MTSPPPLLQSRLASRYTLGRELGHGGMATVYLAEDRKHHRKVAVKVLRPELVRALGPDRFLREIELTAQLTHPHILPLLDSGDAGGQLFYVMPYVEGESLRHRLKREKQLPLDEAIRIAREVADALGHAHGHGVIHRDIKPENILLEAGHAVVADFGVAKAVAVAGTEPLTETGLAVGTPAYMSPEQAAGERDVDGRSDLYSLGCMLYEMLAGQAPFAGPTAEAIRARHATDPVPPLRTVRPTVPAAVEAALAKVLAKVPADRFATAAQFGDALVAGPSASPERRVRRPALGAMVLLLVVAGAWAVSGRLSQRHGAGATAIPLDSTAIAVLPFQVVGADSASPARTLARFMGDLFELKVTGEFGRRIRHPGSVAARWREAGGTLDSAISEEAELAVAREVGASRLVRGTVVAAGDSLVVSASMLDVVTGAVRVEPVRVAGTVARQQELLDHLIILLLARDAGYSPASAPRLAQFKPEAIQAYLAGDRFPGFSRGRKAALHAALAADSNLVDAALELYAWGEDIRDTAELRYAWEHQDRLTERNRAYLVALAAGRHGSIWTEADRIAAYEALALRWPEWSGPWGDVGDQLTNFGALASVPDWSRRAREALERVDRRAEWMQRHLAELAFVDHDTARARAAIESLAARPGTARLVPVYRWRLALMKGETTEAARALPQLADTGKVLQFALTDGRGPFHLLDQIAAGPNPLAAMWAWSRGHERAWREAWRQYGSPAGEISQATVPLFWALLLGPSEDTTVAGAVRALERMADGSRGQQVSDDERALARCWVALWRLQHGDTAGARATRRYLEGGEERRHRFAGWIRMIDVQLAQAEGGDVHAALLRMDSVVRELPLPAGALRWDPVPAEVQNLMLARMLGRYGEPERGLAAARRRFYRAVFNYPDALPEYLREEGRLAAKVGDKAGAIRAYQHYLALRENPDPPWRAPWDSVRAELAALVAE
jgi:protein kinase-like protein